MHISIPAQSPIATAVRRGAAWLTASGIQQENGAVARYYLSDSRRNAQVSFEITGYFASALSYLYETGGDRVYLDAAVRAASSLLAAWDDRSSTFPFEPAADGDPAYAYFFDCGIIARGLLAAWRSTGDAAYLEKAKECALSMAFDFDDGEKIHPVLRLPEKQALAYGARWSRRPGCYQLKAAMAWRDIARETGERAMASAYERVLRFALATHDGFLPGNPDQHKVMDRLHAYAYFLEGLLPVADRPECARALQSGIDRISEWLRRLAPVFARSDVFAQLLRVRVYADALGVIRMDELAAVEEANAICRFQASHPDRRLDGGFWFGKRCGALLPFMNPVSTMFCMQALQMYHEWRAGTFESSITALV